MARKPIPLPLPVEEPPEACPKCPPKGAPAWMATFADIATLLMAFFVLILSFAEFNQPKFKMVAGSLKNSFGVQREVPVFEQPQGTTVLDLKFSPSPEMSVTEEITQDTTETEQPEVKRPVTEDEGKGAAEGESGTAGEAAQQAPQALAEAIRDALQGGQVQVESRDGEVVMTFDAPAAEQLPEQLSEAAKALDGAAEATGQSTAEVLLEGLAEALPDLARATQAEAETQRVEGRAERSAAMAEAELRVALRQEISQGLVSVAQREDRVTVTVGAGGAFPSGEADLTDEARDVMARLAFAAMGEASDIEVTGHTDSVPLSPYSPYRDNWGLAAARASSVVRELSRSGLIASDRLRAIGRGESMPVAGNDTAAGREKNRRIEIEITY